MKLSCLETDWWEDEYSEDVHSHLLKRERNCALLQMKSQLLPFRHVIVDYLNEVCEKMDFCKQVKHLAMYYLDLIMDHYSIQMDHLQLVVMGCIIVAAKAEENVTLIPRMSDFNALVGNIYELHSFVYMEIFIMKFLKWKLIIPTAALFVDYYSLYAVSEDDYHCDAPLDCFDELKNYMEQYIDYFLELSLHNVSFRLFRPSIVAASCVASSRICLFLSPIWSPVLQEVTTYQLGDLKGCLEFMIRILHDEEIVTSSKACEMLESVYSNSHHYDSDTCSTSSLSPDLHKTPSRCCTRY